MVTKKYSTHFIFGWALFGLIMGGIVLGLWPRTTTHHEQTNAPSGLLSGPISYAPAVEKAAPAVVSIQALRIVQEAQGELESLLSKPRLQVRPNQGSGVIIDAQGHVLTNYHVIANASEIFVTLTDGHRIKARVMGSDPDTDLAVLDIGQSTPMAISFGNTGSIKVGDVVLAIGNPFGIGQTVTQGIISATGRDRVGLNTYENFIQTDAAINPGNSGGALVNTAGEIVGINAAIFSQSGNYQGIGFAIPIDMALSVLQQIVEHGGVIRGWLGVEGMDLNPQILQRMGLSDLQGVLITDVFKQGPADRAGLKPGDIITHINQIVIRDTRDVLNAVANGRPGDKTKISGIRQGESFVIQATLAQRPQLSN
ncbi:MAG: PDZ domain-containing protein [Gammaproteobacteria bacterium]|nr:MAG: PDZ domain-containing protein [Gammaproteobacteria bacterium]